MAAQLPLELLLQVFDLLELHPDLIRASLVCAGWRAAALFHGSYYKQIVLRSRHLDDMQASRTAFASAQLARAPSNEQGITICITATGFTCGFSGSDLVASFCRAALKEQFGRVHSLSVCYSDVVLAATMDALRRGSTSLNKLRLMMGFIHKAQHYVLEHNGDKPVAVIPETLLARKGTILRRMLKAASPPLLHRKRVPAQFDSPVVFMESSPVGGPILGNGFVRRRDNSMTLTLTRSLDVLTPNLTTLHLQYIEFSDRDALHFKRVELLWLEFCRGMPLQRIISAFPGLLSLGLIIPEGEDNNRVQLDNEMHSWLKKLNRLHTDDVHLLEQIIPEELVPNLTLIDPDPKRRPLMPNFTRLLTNWHSQQAGMLELCLRPLDDDLHAQPALQRLYFSQTQSERTYGMRVHLVDHSLQEWRSRVTILFMNAGHHIIPSNIGTLCLPETHLQVIVQMLHFLSQVRLVEVLLNDMGRFTKVIPGTWHSRDLPSLQIVRLIRVKSEFTRAAMLLNGRELCRAIRSTFTVGSASKLNIEFGEGVHLLDQQEARTISMSELDSIYGEGIV
ncbi:hypothetical protein BKA62DRAFT_695071 [Auriculariales sp. MPI-PUGE-AT-0066]|nr:hypothetical protein BKA62DRAFT_695071 [Auriculariales sp. MPI-PUGE-AT-0066]